MPEPGRTAAVHADAAVPDGLLDAFWRYEAALMADDVPALDALFAGGPWTLRGDAGGLLVGHDAIAAFRRGRGGAPQRRVAAVHVRVLGQDTAAVVAVVEPRTGGRGQQTQVWRRGPGAGRCSSHTSRLPRRRSTGASGGRSARRSKPAPAPGRSSGVASPSRTSSP
ncbi:AtzH-like domain-containing protein [Amnibacterium kyonggiense]